MPALTPPSGPAQLSVVLPVRDEVDVIGGVLDELLSAQGRNDGFDILAVDDGSEDGSADLLDRRAREEPALRVVRHARPAGQSAALRTGARAARGDWLILMDGDGQYDPRDIPRLTAVLDAEAPLPALVYGIRTRRGDPLSKRIASRAANRVRRFLLRDGCPDTGCGLKLINREVFLDLPYFAGLHRFIPALVQCRGYRALGLPVRHRPRTTGVSKYGNLERALVGIVDLLGVVWLTRRTPRPEVRPAAAETLLVEERARVGPR